MAVSGKKRGEQYGSNEGGLERDSMGEIRFPK